MQPPDPLCSSNTERTVASGTVSTKSTYPDDKHGSIPEEETESLDFASKGCIMVEDMGWR